jgi:uncharacterized protein YndB with AHSA1/START domain
MSVTDTTVRSQIERISFEYDLSHAPEKVWRALTDSAQLAEWLLPVDDFGLEPGSSFTFRAEPQPGWDGRVNCRLLEIEEHRKISYTWVVGDPGSGFFIDTVVTFTLTRTATGTRLSLVQTGFRPDQKQASGGARYGWRKMGGKLEDLLGRIP